MNPLRRFRPGRLRESAGRIPTFREEDATVHVRSFEGRNLAVLDGQVTEFMRIEGIGGPFPLMGLTWLAVPADESSDFPSYTCHVCWRVPGAITEVLP